MNRLDDSSRPVYRISFPWGIKIGRKRNKLYEDINVRIMQRLLIRELESNARRALGLVKKDIDKCTKKRKMKKKDGSP